MKVKVNMHYHIWGSYHAKFGDDDFNSFLGIAGEGHTHRQTLASSILNFFNFENNKKYKQIGM